MNDAVINIRTDKEIKEQANRIFEDMGLNTSAAINLFLKQTVLKRRLPFDIESNVKSDDARNTYPEGYFNLFGSGKDLDIEEPKDIDIMLDGEVEPLWNIF